MFTKSVSMSYSKEPYLKNFKAEFSQKSEFAPDQELKNTVAIQYDLKKEISDKNISEISSESINEAGVNSSASILKEYAQSLDKEAIAENVFKSDKVFKNGSYSESTKASPINVNRDEHSVINDAHIGLQYEDMKSFSYPQTSSRAHIDMNSSIKDYYAVKIVKFNASADIEFSQSKSAGYQDKLTSVFSGLYNVDKTEDIKNIDTLIDLYN